MREAADQRRAIAAVNEQEAESFRLLQGIEANIAMDGRLT